VVAGRRAAPRHRRGLRRRPGPRRDPDRRLAGRACDHPGGAARQAGAGAGGGAGGGDRAASHLPRRRSAPPLAPADQRPGAGRREMAGIAHRGRARLAGCDQRDRARRGRHRPAVPERAGRARIHPGPHRRNTAAGRVRGCVQRPGGPDRAQSGPLRTGVDGRASRSDPGAGAAAGLGCAGVGRGPPRQGHPATGCGPHRPVGGRAGRPGLSRPRPPRGPRTDTDRRHRPARRRGNSADPAGRRPLGVERRRCPRRGRAAARRRGHRRRRRGAGGAGRGPHRPHDRAMRAAPGPEGSSRAHPGVDLPAGARRRGRPHGPVRRPQRSPRGRSAARA
jgi:hypothetical protein